MVVKDRQLEQPTIRNRLCRENRDGITIPTYSTAVPFGISAKNMITRHVLHFMSWHEKEGATGSVGVCRLIPSFHIFIAVTGVFLFLIL